jgi:hypothetical protein
MKIPVILWAEKRPLFKSATSPPPFKIYSFGFPITTVDFMSTARFFYVYSTTPFRIYSFGFPITAVDFMSTARFLYVYSTTPF